MDVEKGSGFAEKPSDALGVLAHEKAGWPWISSGDDRNRGASRHVARATISLFVGQAARLSVKHDVNACERSAPVAGGPANLRPARQPE